MLGLPTATSIPTIRRTIIHNFFCIVAARRQTAEPTVWQRWLRRNGGGGALKKRLDFAAVPAGEGFECKELGEADLVVLLSGSLIAIFGALPKFAWVGTRK